MIRSASAWLVLVCLAVAGISAAASPDELQERLKQLDQEADQLQSRGRLDEAQEIRQHMRELQERVQAERGGQREHGPELKETHRQLDELLTAAANAQRHGRGEQMRELKVRIQEVTQRLLELEIDKRVAALQLQEPEHAPGDAHDHEHGDHDHEHGDLEREHGQRPHEPGDQAREHAERIEQLRAAARKLDRAGLGEEAGLLARRAEEMQRRGFAPGPAPPAGNRDAELGEIHRGMQELHRAVEQLRQEIREIHERLNQQRPR